MLGLFFSLFLLRNFKKRFFFPPTSLLVLSLVMLWCFLEDVHMLMRDK